MSAYTVTSRSFVVSGLNVKIYCHPCHSVCEAFAPLLPISVLFFLHGRRSSLAVVEPIIEKVVMMAHSDDRKRDLYVVGIDLRNHGPRLVDEQANMSWSEGNPNHALDMYGIQLGTQRDLSHLIDFLPLYLFPNGERTIVQWGVAGISLGGHTAWLALAHEPRITFAVVILGCADYLALMSRRAAESEFELASPTLPPSLVSLIGQVDPIYTPYTVNDSRNPFLGKKILVLRGAMDRIVPWSASARFVQDLQVGERGLKKVMVQEGVGHECTLEMTKLMAEFLRYECLSSKIATVAKL
ncbi:hypothetical protein BDN71DRAFT_1483035 [Pleurotus eryngii]|uniref:Peptidase S9 prolyl oligopeptidase catalytic domain-containing protein n=1 Tax=Pleurotus eryngii TaxID=5323 RepID=A0A9P5ZVL4_PLEER|nr:hypothetical protein BDN71DRAFT_1483035 [Pleurotus eryngii]